MDIGFLLTHAPDSEAFQTLCAEADHELSVGNHVSVFVDADGMAEGVVDPEAYLRPLSSAMKGAARKPLGLEDLMDRGAHVTLCRTCAQDRGLFTDPTLIRANLGDYEALSSMVGRVDRFISL